jgi:hypothetical protein
MIYFDSHNAGQRKDVEVFTYENDRPIGDSVRHGANAQPTAAKAVVPC